jgi:hypothetical protein
LALGSSIAKESYLALREDIGESILVDNLGFDLGFCLKVVGTEEGSIDLHSASIEHRAEESRSRGELLKSGAEDLQSVDRNQWDIEAIAKPLGNAGANAQASIAARPLRKGYSIELPAMGMGLLHEFFDEDGQLASMVGSCEIGFDSRSLAIDADGSRASVGGGFNAEYGHSY